MFKDCSSFQLPFSLTYEAPLWGMSLIMPVLKLTQICPIPKTVKSFFSSLFGISNLRNLNALRLNSHRYPQCQHITPTTLQSWKLHGAGPKEQLSCQSTWEHAQSPRFHSQPYITRNSGTQHTSKFSIQEVKAGSGWLDVKGHPQLHSKFKVSLGQETDSKSKEKDLRDKGKKAHELHGYPSLNPKVNIQSKVRCRFWIPAHEKLLASS